MTRWRLKRLLADWPVQAGMPDVEVGGVSLDTRTLKPGELFVALEGRSGHGLQYLDAAREKGCSAILYDPEQDAGIRGPRSPGAPLVAVPGLSARLGELASRFFGAPSEFMTVVGVTGTNGKTTTAHFVAQAWQRLGGSAGYIGTIGAGLVDNLADSSMTTPDSFGLQRLLARCRDEGADLVAMEVSSHALDQGRCETVQFDVAVLTNISREHLDYHRDMKEYAAAKKRLFEDFRPRFAVINGDDPIGRRWIEYFDGDLEVLSYSCGREPADIRAEIGPPDADGECFTLLTPWGEGVVRSGLVGGFNVQNLLAAAGVLGLLGVDFPAMLAQLQLMQAVPGRMVRLGGGERQPLVIVDYAHTPDALEKALEAARGHAGGRLICVFGAGGDRDTGKRGLMGAVAERLADRVIVTSDNPRTEDPGKIIRQVLDGMQRPEQAIAEPDRAAAINQAVCMAGYHDVVLVAGKGHEKYQVIGELRIPFDDEREVRRALGEAA